MKPALRNVTSATADECVRDVADLLPLLLQSTKSTNRLEAKRCAFVVQSRFRTITSAHRLCRLSCDENPFQGKCNLCSDQRSFGENHRCGTDCCSCTPGAHPSKGDQLTHHIECGERTVRQQLDPEGVSYTWIFVDVERESKGHSKTSQTEQAIWNSQRMGRSRFCDPV